MGCEYTSPLSTTGNVVIIPGPNSTNVYSQALVPFSSVTTILTFVVAVPTFTVFSFIGWGDTVGEFLIKVNGVTKGGGRTSAATPVFTADYTFGPIPTVLGDVITITAEHFYTATHTMKANLIGG